MQLRDIAPEFYTTLKYHTSWIYVIWAFLTDTDVGPWTRMKRKTPTGTPADAPVMSTGMAQRQQNDAHEPPVHGCTVYAGVTS